MSRRATGWLLLAWAFGAAAVAVGLGRADGHVDDLLVALVGLAVAGAWAVVLLDRRHARHRRAQLRAR